MLSPRIHSIVLAAGSSARMESPKALLMLGRKTFMQRVVESMREANVEEIIVVLGADANRIAPYIQALNVQVVLNHDFARGQLSSIHVGLDLAEKQNADAVLIHPVDRPLITPSLVSDLISAFIRTAAPVVVPVFKERRGHPVLFSASVFGELRTCPPETGARQVVWSHAAELTEVATSDEGCLMNIDTPADYETVKARFGV